LKNEVLGSAYIDIAAHKLIVSAPIYCAEELGCLLVDGQNVTFKVAMHVGQEIRVFHRGDHKLFGYLLPNEGLADGGGVVGVDGEHVFIMFLIKKRERERGREGKKVRRKRELLCLFIEQE
jgi:hypothetical protein